MGYAGDPSRWADSFPDGLVGNLLDLVLSAWQSFQRPRPGELEVPITQRFCVHLRRQKDRSRLPLSIEPESQVLVPGTGALVGRIDLKFSHGYREDVYFSLECKRLNVIMEGGRRSLAADYVDKGMMRYITGKYCKDLDKSGMLAYVMDGQIADAISAVTKAVDGRRLGLMMANSGALGPSSYRPGNSSIRESRHSLRRGIFMIQHIFVSAAT
jgi:hypothetical protein